MLPPVFATLQAATAVTAVLGDPPRVYRRGNAPQDATKPYVSWQVIGDAPENELSDVPGIDRCSIEVNAWHREDAGCVALAKAVRDAIEPVAHMTSIVIDEREQETKLYRIAMQFDWWLGR